MRKFNVILGLLLALPVCLFTYTRVIENNMLTVRYVDIPVNSSELDGITIVQFSDTHIGMFNNMEKFRDLVDRVNSLDGDIVVFTGDFIDHHNGDYNDKESLIVELNRINSGYGKFSVYGNHDVSDDVRYDYSNSMLLGGFTVLNNYNYTLKVGNADINLIGIDDTLKLSGSDMTRLVQSDMYNLLLVHEPDSILSTTGAELVDLALSGHTHGGQIRLPIVGPLHRVRGGKLFDKGLYSLNGLNYIYVSSGVGYSRLPFRLGNIPEVIKFKLVYN